MGTHTRPLLEPLLLCARVPLVPLTPLPVILPSSVKVTTSGMEVKWDTVDPATSLLAMITFWVFMPQLPVVVIAMVAVVVVTIALASVKLVLRMQEVKPALIVVMVALMLAWTASTGEAELHAVTSVPQLFPVSPIILPISMDVFHTVTTPN